MNKTVNNNLTKKNTGRRRASLIMLFAFIVLIPSGILMHLNDSTAGSHYNKFTAMAVHNLSAIIFVVSGIFHIKFNFNLIKKYISETCFSTAGKESAE